MNWHVTAPAAVEALAQTKRNIARWMLMGLPLLISVSHASVVIDAATMIMIDRGEPAPLQRAAADLAADLEEVLGARIRIVSDPTQLGHSAIWIALNHAGPAGVRRPSGHERLHIQVIERARPSPASTALVVLTGSDVRGAIYSIYQFSQKFLGVDPLYWWTDAIPERRTEVRVPDGYVETEGPVFRHRGWFINDEDLLTGWKPGGADGSGISLAIWDRIFESILRLKGNVVIPGTFTFPDEPQIRAAGKRGLIITQHHITTVGLNTYRWPEDKPMSYAATPALLRSAWARAIEQYPKGVEVLWSVGFRGKHDRPFWSDDPSAPSIAEARAKIIRSAIDDQMSLVRRRYPKARFLMNTYGEAGFFIRQRVLTVPEAVTLIQADNGRGTIESASSGARGVYYHTAMYDGLSNHYSEMVPLERIHQELGQLAGSGATEMLLVNTANVRPVLMTTRAVMELAWNPLGWDDPMSNQSGSYLSRWVKAQFGEEAAPLVADYYRAYFKAPARYGSAEDRTMGDEFYYAAARELIAAAFSDHKDGVQHVTQEPPSASRATYVSRAVGYARGREFSTTLEFASMLLEACSAADERWRGARAVAVQARPLVLQGRTMFFQASVIAQVELHLHLNRMLMHLAEMVANANESSDDKQSHALRSAIAEASAAADALRAANYGKWKGFYTEGDWLLDTQGLLALMRTHLAGSNGDKNVPEFPQPTDPAGLADAAYSKITAYQGQRRTEFLLEPAAQR